MKSTIISNKKSIAKRWNKTLFFALAITTLFATFNSCTAEEMPKQNPILHIKFQDAEPIPKPPEPAIPAEPIKR